MAVRPRSAKLESVLAYDEPLVIISPRQQPVTCTQDLPGRQAYVWPTGCPYRAEFERWLDHHAVSLPTTILASYGAILGCVRTGSGISVVAGVNGADGGVALLSPCRPQAGKKLFCLAAP